MADARHDGLRERPRGAGWAVAITSLCLLALLVLAPLVVVLVEAFAEGAGTFLDAITDEDTVSALGLTLLVVAIVVPFHTVFGVAAAWLLTRQDFRGKALLGTLIDLPFTVSPVVSGLLFVLLFGARGWLGPWLRDHDVRVVYAVPGVVIATLFVTLPFVVRELVPTMEAIGRDEEEAAASLGASGWQILWRVTLPRVRWALFYGCVLCGARAAGEFGAVSVVSGHVRGETSTLPLHVEILWGEYHTAAAFAVASMLAASGLVTLVLRGLLERRVRASKARSSSAAHASAALALETSISSVPSKGALS
ncbi:MAG: sulfate ABC transporter permease subunit CysW [Sandaracinaceae bacterium]|nr:sulfate ABC transporter permease subunit CysW [Sandaracinaceae bacterium]